MARILKRRRRFGAFMQEQERDPPQYGLWAGFIPECFVKVPVDLRFSFVLLDVDNYEPTRDSLAWIWPRMNCNGILALDDFYPRHDGEASLAIKEFLRQADDYHIVDRVNAQLVLRKTR